MKKLISVKLDPPLLKWLDKKAKQENRARNNLIETILIKEREADTMSEQDGMKKNDYGI